MKVVLERDNEEEEDKYKEEESERQENKEKSQIFKVEILAGDARKVSAVRFEKVEHDDTVLGANGVAPSFPKIMKRNRPRDEDFDRSYNHENQADVLDLSLDEDGFGKDSDGSSGNGIVVDHLDSLD